MLSYVVCVTRVRCRPRSTAKVADIVMLKRASLRTSAEILKLGTSFSTLPGNLT